jgi:hypothetical protein
MFVRCDRFRKNAAAPTVPIEQIIAPSSSARRIEPLEGYIENLILVRGYLDTGELAREQRGFGSLLGMDVKIQGVCLHPKAFEVPEVGFVAEKR